MIGPRKWEEIWDHHAQIQLKEIRRRMRKDSRGYITNHHAQGEENMMVFFITNFVFFFSKKDTVYMPYLLGLFQCMELVLGAQSIGELSIIGKKMVLKYHNEKLGSCNDRFDLMSNTDHMPLLKQKLQS